MSELPFDHAAVLAVRCPFCGVPAGEPCRTSRGKKKERGQGSFHNERKMVVYPRFGRGETGLKRGRAGTMRVFGFTAEKGATCLTGVALARNAVAVMERLRVRAREENIELDDADMHIVEVDVNDGDQLVVIRTQT